jgi:acetyl esterase/lipase
MKHQTVHLKDYFPNGIDAVLECDIIENFPNIESKRKHKAILILPGGAYERVSPREADPIAFKFLQNDISIFILKYKTKNLKYPNQLIQAIAALAIIRKNSRKWNLDTNQIYVLGCSAGGHLALNLATINKYETTLLNKLNLIKKSVKVNGLILCYPVVTFADYAHIRTRNNLLPINASTPVIDSLSLETRISKKTPKTFLWHTYNDSSVLLENTLILANNYKKHDVDLELHIYSDGVHGLSCADKTSACIDNPLQINQHVSSWINLCLNWINRQK